MNCDQVKSILSCYYDCECVDENVSLVEQHLSNCSDCREELASFEGLSDLFSRSLLSDHAGSQVVPNWEAVSAKLSVDSSEKTTVLTDDSAWWGGIGPRRMAIGFGLALAASLLLLVIPRKVDSPKGDGELAPGEIAIDYSTLLGQFAGQPALALQSLGEKFDGREVSANDFEEMIGYRPRIATSLPSGMRLVSTKVLRLPECMCEDGKCTCAPGKCNCAAALCQRQDGSELLVIEHCESKGVTFGSMSARPVGDSNHALQLMGQGAELIASWATGSRRYTAVGLKDDSEAMQLASAFDSP